MKRFFSLLLVLTMMLSVAIIGVSAEKKTFPDVQEGKWFYESVMEAAELGLMQGNADGTFAPTASITRAQMVILVARFAGVDYENYPTTKKFKDVGLTNWYSGAICWASDEGLVNGVSATEFAPNKNITRQELAKLIIGLIDYLDVYVPDATDAIAKFADKSSIAKWAKDYVEALRKTGLVKGDSNGNFNPTSNTTRAEVSTLVVRLNPYIHPAEDDVDLIMQQFAAGVCETHNEYHVFCGFTSSMTAETFAGYVHTWMGLDGDNGRYVVEADEADIDAIRDDYSGQGIGSSAEGDIGLKLTDTVSGNETDWVSVKFRCKKFPDAAGDMGNCPEDYAAADYINSLDEYFELDDAGRLKVALGGGATFTEENISNIILTAIGLSPRAYRVIFDEDEFAVAKNIHGGLAHSQVHAEDISIAIRDLAESEFRTGLVEEGEGPIYVDSETVEWTFRFSKDTTEVMNSWFPDENEVINYSGEATKEALEAFLLDYVRTYDDGAVAYVTTCEILNFDALTAAKNGGTNPVDAECKFVYPAEDFFDGNMAELPDSVFMKTYKISFAG